MLRTGLFLSSLTISLFIAVPLLAQPEVEWSLVLGDTGPDIAYGIDQTFDGGYIVAGTYYNTNTMGSEYYLLKLSFTGSIEWQQSYDIAGWASAGVRQTQDGGYVLAGRVVTGPNMNPYIMKTDPFGVVEWDYTGPAEDSWSVSDIELDQNGDILVVGRFYFNLSWRHHVMRIQPDGLLIWERTYFNANMDAAILPADNNSCVYITTLADHPTYMTWMRKIDINGDLVWEQSFDVIYEYYNEIIEVGSGYAITGSVYHDPDMALYLTDYDGNRLDQFEFGDVLGNEVGNTIKPTTDNCLIMAGYTSSWGAGGNDGYVVKSDMDGNEVWYKTVGGPENEEFHEIIETADGGYIAVGWTTSFGAGAEDIYIVKLEGPPSGPVAFHLQPIAPPIVIPAGGGAFQYNGTITNLTENLIQGDMWTEVDLPSGNTYGPLVVSTGLSMLPYATSQFVNFAQNVPFIAPPGTYTFRMNLGFYDYYLAASDEFTFTKEAQFSTADQVDDWSCSGFESAAVDGESNLEQLPPRMADIGCTAYPNPFNAATTIRVSLPQTSAIRLAVFDVQGRLVETLHRGNTSTGIHSYTLDAATLSSGLYFAALEVDGQLHTLQKLVLVK